LQAHHQIAGRDRRLAALVGARGMAAHAPQHDLEIVLGRHEGTGPRAERADLQPRHVVDAVHLLEGEAIEQPVLDHRQRASAPFPGGLEEEAHGAADPLGHLEAEAPQPNSGWR
jgi:hypothetical protein